MIIIPWSTCYWRILKYRRYYRINDSGILKDVEFLKNITETSRWVISTFVDKTMKKKIVDMFDSLLGFIINEP